jgi:hypothetical protein
MPSEERGETMSRKPSALLSYKLRIREALRRRIEQAATRRGVSANAEMVSRLERSFEQEAHRSIDESAAHLKVTTAHFDGVFHGLSKQGDIVRAAEALLKQIDGGNSEATKKAAAKVRQVIEMIDREAVLAVRKAHTTGGDQ